MGYAGLNRNVLVAMAASIAVSAAVAQYFGDREAHVNATLATAADYGAFFSVFAAAFYVENRLKYRTASGGTDTARLYRDLWRLVASLGAAEIVYTASRWTLQYHLLGMHEAYAASIMAQAASTAIYLVALNIGVKVARLYRDGS